MVGMPVKEPTRIRRMIHYLLRPARPILLPIVVAADILVWQKLWQRRLHPWMVGATRRRALRRLSRTKRPVTLFLTPEAGLTPFFANHILLAKTLQSTGHPSLILSCHGLLPSCSYKFAESVKFTKPDQDQSLCRQCRRQAVSVFDEYGLLDISVESLLTEEDLAEIGKIVALHAAAPWEASHQGIKFGQSALAEVLRSERRLDASELAAEDLDLLRAILSSSLTIYFAFKSALARYPIKRIVSMGEYAFWIPSHVFAERNGIAVTHLDNAYNFDIDQRFIGLRSTNSTEANWRQIESWPKHREAEIDPTKIDEIAASSLYRMQAHGGSSTYSPNWDRERTSLLLDLGLDPERKTIVAYSSSNDEVISARAQMEVIGRPFPEGRSPFSSQSAWLESLLEWLGPRSDLQLIVRLHPRMAAGHRHSAAATEYHKLKALLAQRPSNVAVVWPETKISSYNLAEIADAATISWSTIGLELARLGVPVVAAFSGIGSFPTGKFISFEEDQDSYFATMAAALHRPASLQDITEAFRWTHLMVWSNMVDVSDVVLDARSRVIPKWQLPRNHDIITRVLTKDEDIFDLNMTRLSRGAEKRRSEQKAISQAIRRFVCFFVSGQDLPDISIQRVSPQADRFVAVETKDAVYRRYSPLAHRLATTIAGQSGPLRPLAEVDVIHAPLDGIET
jgi:hypothetical protein